MKKKMSDKDPQVIGNNASFQLSTPGISLEQMEPTNQSLEQQNDLTQEDANEPADLEDGRERDIPDPISATTGWFTT
jgi:hypothetical protein